MSVLTLYADTVLLFYNLCSFLPEAASDPGSYGPLCIYVCQVRWKKV